MRTTPSPAADPVPATRGDATRDALLHAALQVFARDGFDAASTRAIAEAAGANQALIGYHYGGKEGLYLAVFDHIVAELRARVGPLVLQIEALLAEPEPDPPPGPALRRRRYLPPLLAVADGMLGLMLGPHTEHWSQLILREQARPTAAFERLYEGFMARVLGVLTGLVLRLRGDGDQGFARLAVVAMLGQLLVWRAARAGVMRHLGWRAVGERELELARGAVRRGLAAQVLSRGPLPGNLS